MVRGFKKTEIGCVPEDWDVKPFGDVFTTLSNNTLSRDNLNYDRGLIKDIHYGDVLIRYPELLDCTREDVPYINHNAKVSCQPLHEGDVVISDTAEDETVGKATEIIKEGKTGVVAGLHTIPCRVKNGEFVPGWLGYFINSHFYHDQLIPYIHGTKVSSIARESLYDTYVVIPPFDEQKRIIQSLSDTDALIAKSERLIKKYQAMKQGFLQHMFPRKGQTAPDLRLPGFTDPWEQRKLGDISEIKTGPFESSLHADDYVVDGVPIITTEHFKNGQLPEGKDGLPQVSEDDYRRLATYVMEDGDLVFSRVGSVDINALVTQFQKGWLFSGRVLRVRPDREYDSQYLHVALETESVKNDIRSRAVGQTMPSINTEILNETPVIISKELKEQKLIGEYFLNLDRLITLHQRKCEKYKMIKQGMMEELLTGKVRLK